MFEAEEANITSAGEKFERDPNFYIELVHFLVCIFIDYFTVALLKLLCPGGRNNVQTSSLCFRE